jgi:hypothetical protein
MILIPKKISGYPSGPDSSITSVFKLIISLDFPFQPQNMKKLLFFIPLLFAVFLSTAQDTIISYSGEKTIAKVLEINSMEVKYKKFNFLDGPTYLVSKNDIHMIKYANGLVETIEKSAVQMQGPQQPAKEDLRIYDYGLFYKYQHGRVGLNDIHQILNNTKDPQLMGLVKDAKKYRKLQLIGLGAIPLGIGAFAFAVSGLFIDETYFAAALPCLIVGVACPIVGGTFKHKSTLTTKRAIQEYNLTH